MDLFLFLTFDALVTFAIAFKKWWLLGVCVVGFMTGFLIH